MKNTILSFCAIWFLTSSVPAQSTFWFENYSDPHGINAPVFDANGNRLAGASYAAELWGGLAANSLSPTLDFNTSQRVFVPFGTGITAGYFSSSKSMTVFGTAGGGFAWVQVRAWDARLGATYEVVAAFGMGGYGESSLLYIRGGDPTAVPPTVPASLIGLQSFSLRPIPEPSVWQLSVLSVPAILFFRRNAKSYVARIRK